MKRLFLLCLLFLQVSLTKSEEYLYPIANLDDATILMMHQKSLDDLELISLNTTNNKTQKLLSSLYLPAYVKIIPGKKRYSFIDRGRIYIKDFSKRTPRGIDIYQPIFDIQSLQWVSDHECVFSAKYKSHYKIFMYDLDKEGGTLYSLCNLGNDINYIFPSFANNRLFCLTQSDSSEFYKISQITADPVVFEQAIPNNESGFSIKTYPVEHKKSLCFLTMHSQKEGYVLEIIEHNQNEKTFVFGCCKIDLDKSYLSHLFEFQIPEEFIVGMENNRFFESLYPLLPHYAHQDIIYFTSYDKESKKLVLYEYNKENQAIVKFQTDTKKIELRHTFSPLIINDQIYVGHNIEAGE